MKYKEALDEFEQESNIHLSLGKPHRMHYGRASRMVGEVYLMIEKYDDALKHENIYLEVSKQENDLIEMQRALLSVGRCYLLLAESKNKSNEARMDFKAAERTFLKSLMICKE